MRASELWMGATYFASRSGLLSNVAVIETREELTRTLVPNAGIVVGIRYRGETVILEDGVERSFPTHALQGIHPVTRRVRTSARGGMVLALMRPEVAHRLVREPLHALFRTTCALDDLFGRDRLTKIANRLFRATSAAERRSLFEDFLLSMLGPAKPDIGIERAVHAIESTFGNIRISELSRRIGSSQDAFEKRFRRAVGATPKQFASLVRFRRAMELSAAGRSLTQISCEAGYADQSHFIRSFRAVTGQAPREFLRAQAYC